MNKPSENRRVQIQREVAEKFGTGQSTLSKTLKNRYEIENLSVNNKALTVNENAVAKKVNEDKAIKEWFFVGN